MEWKDIWIEEPPRNEEIFFMTGDETIHLGEIFSEDKLRKCKFHSFTSKADYECDSKTPYEDRVIYWFPIPKQPERLNLEDAKVYAGTLPDCLNWCDPTSSVCDSPTTENK